MGKIKMQEHKMIYCIRMRNKVYIFKGVYNSTIYERGYRWMVNKESLKAIKPEYGVCWGGESFKIQRDWFLV